MTHGLPDIFFASVPFFGLCIAVEVFVGHNRWARASYEFKDAMTSIIVGIGFGVISAIFLPVAVLILSWLAQYQLMRFEYGWLAFFCLFLIDDFFYYWLHRVTHRTRFGWAMHVNHHSSQYLNLATAMRQSWTANIAISLLNRFPLVLMGFTVEMILIQRTINLILQFWIHTETIGRLPRLLEFFLNTPTHHRVHHSIRPEHLDKNYAGVLIIWDRMFGTFQENDPTRENPYGVVGQIATHNILKVVFHEWHDLFSDLRRTKDWRRKFALMLRPPGWQPEKTEDSKIAAKGGAN